MSHISLWNLSTKTDLLTRIGIRKKKSKKLSTPLLIEEFCDGIDFNGQKVKSILFSTDLALIENSNCDAILAVYPFAPSKKIMETIIKFSNKPVICGVGGGVTQGVVSIQMAVEAEKLGACAVIVNQPFKNEDIKKMKQQINIPIISSISTLDFDFQKRINSGVDIFNVTGGSQTNELLNYLRKNYPEIPCISTAGQSIESLDKTLKSNASAIILTPPSTSLLFKEIMSKYRTNIRWFEKLFNR